jgi:hypothetical protein
MNKIKNFLVKYELKLALIAGFILVAVISFQFGYLEGKRVENKPIVIEKIVEVNNNQENSMSVVDIDSAQNKNKSAEASAKAVSCLFVGSKNSNKIHLPTCSFAKRIKPENLVCFKSLDEAIKQGKQADKSCIK